jgi:hypothetical protein
MGFVGSLENMLFGDPVYDERGRVVKRNFGLMNAAIIVLLVVLGIGLFKGFPNMKPKSGKKKMKGGSGRPRLTPEAEMQIDRGELHPKVWGNVLGAIASITIAVILILSLKYLFEGHWQD